jgi:23S rRNA U2552 (ribose-2'-O)-methylase RlmE/FtsJ
MVAAGARKGLTDFYAKEAKRLGYVARSAFKLLELSDRFGILRKGAHVLDLGCHPGAWTQVACRALGHPDEGGGVLGVDLRETELGTLRHVDRRARFAVADATTLCEKRLRALRGGDGDGDGDESIATRRRTRPFTVVLSDMAPSTTGAADVDAARSYELAEAAVRIALGERALDVLYDDDDDDDDDDEGSSSFGHRTSAISSSPDPDGGDRGGREETGVLRKGGSLVVKLLEGPGGGKADLQAVCARAFGRVRWYRPRATRRDSSEVFLVARGRR